MEEFLVEDILKESHLLFDIKTFQRSELLLNEIGQKPDTFDIVMLDIEMPNINGLLLGNKIKAINRKILIIYLTGYEKYALSSFENRPFDYIMKPIEKSRLKRCLNEAIKEININEFVEEDAYDKLVITINKRIVTINQRKILFIEKMRNICDIICTNDRYTTYDTLKNMEKHLSEDFYKCHQSYIVNLNHIREYTNKNFIMSDESIIPISKGHMKEAKNRFYDSLRG